MKVRCQTMALMAAIGLGLVACGAAPPKPTTAKAQLVSASDANPDATGRPSPVVVRLYQLREEGAFNAADFFALYDHEQESLGASLINREEYVLAPGEQRALELTIAPDAQFISAIAAYRDVRSSHWKAITPAPAKKLMDMLSKTTLTVTVAKAAVTISLSK